MDKKPLVIIAGPTAVGKTASSIKLAKKIGGEIISADSIQVYKMMDIGSAKIQAEEMDGVTHHLISVLDPREPFNVTRFQAMAKQAMEEIYSRNHIPIICGGTGFYTQSVLYDIDFPENSPDLSYRESLYAIAKEQGAEVLFEMLKKVDPESCEIIPMNNVKRVARALEFYHDTGEKISAHNEAEHQKESPYDYRYFALFTDREKMYEKIDIRVDKMLKNGLLSEMETLIRYGCTREMTSMQGLGYKQLYAHYLNECTLEEAIENIKKETRHFAKRQLTWLRREKNVIWVDVEKEDLTDVYETRPFGTSN